MLYKNMYVAHLHKIDHISNILSATELTGGLFLGNVICLIKTDLLIDNCITAVLTCSSETVNSPKYSSMKSAINQKKIVHKVILAEDNQLYPIQNHFVQCIDFINANLQLKRNVLVHCHAGRSRSATIVMAYLLHQHGMDPTQAYQLVKKKRPAAEPNPGFKLQIQNFYQTTQKLKISDTSTRLKTQQTLPNSLVLSQQEQPSQLRLSGPGKKRKPLEIKQQQVRRMKSRIQRLIQS